MIRFTLRCDRDHGFEAWFRGNDDFDAQRERGLVACPVCDSAEVTKALMAPAVARGRDRSPAATQAPTPVPEGRSGPGDATATAPAAATNHPSLAAGSHAALRAAMRGLAAKVRAETVDVGARFPEEARRIHYGDAEERAIRGRASPDEAKALVEEGVRIAPVPIAPDEAN